MRTSVRRAVLAFGVAALGLSAVAPGVGAGAQSTAEQPGSRRMEIIPSVEAELVQVDVVVTDKDGRLVTNLKQQDFVLLEDGKPQQISHFLVSSHRPAPVAESAPDTPGAEPPAEAPLGRYVVLAVDDLHMSTSSLFAAKAALKRFVDRQVSDEDAVAIATTSGSAGLFQPFTQDRWALHHAIDRLTLQERRASGTGRSHMSEFEAESIERGDQTALQFAVQEIMQSEAMALPGRAGAVANPRAEAEARGTARRVLSEALDVSVQTLGTLESIVRGLGPVSGRKFVVLVSDGFLVGSGARDSRSFDLRRIIDASARSGVAIYALDTRGLTAGSAGGDASSAAPLVQAAPGVRERLERQSQLMLRESMGSLAEGTGGLLVHGSNDLSMGLERILRDNDAGYLMAYQPVSERDGRFHKIEVRLPGHPGLTVRARKGYVATAPDRAAADRAGAAQVASSARRELEIRQGLASLFPLKGVPIRMSADFLDAPPDGTQLLIRGHVDLAGIRFDRAGDRQKADVEVLGVVYDESGRIVGEMEGQHADMSLGPASYEQALKQGLRYQRTVPLKPGRYLVRVVARDATFSQLGSAFQWVEIPDLSTGTLTLSNVFLFTDAPTSGRSNGPAPAAAKGVEGLQEIQALRRLERGKGLYYAVYVYNPSRSEDGDTDVVLQAQVWSGEKLQGASPVQVVPFEHEGASLPMTSRIALEGLGTGDYELRLLASDRKANTNALRRISFSID